MKPADLLLYLLGNRGAIERIASSRRALWAGALLVLSAGVARNYDHLFLLAQPEWIYGPFGMSLFSAGFIWLVLRAEISRDGDGGKLPSFRIFLTLFWLTAPCAWLYGFPVERFMDLVPATKWNFAFLMVVAAWRVALIVRSVTVLTGAGVGRILSFVLFPACIEMGIGSLFKGLSLVGIMGGVRLPPHHEFLKHASGVVLVGSFWLGTASLLGIIFYAASRRGLAKQPLWREPGREDKGIILTATVCLMGWLLIALPVQGPVSRNFQLNRYFANQQWREGIAFASARQQSDFSAIHFLPPDPFRNTYGNAYGNSYFELLEAMDGSEPEWLKEVWTSQALMELELNLSLPSLDGTAAKVFSRYPLITAGLARKVGRLKSQTELDEDEAAWLRDYRKMMEPLKTAPP